MTKQPVAFIPWPDLTEGVLVKRYKRFLADVIVGDQLITAHTPNTGRMLLCSEPGRRVWLSFHDNPKRRLKYSWEMIEMPDGLVGVNTTLPNRLAALAVSQGLCGTWGFPSLVETEVSLGQARSRLDLKITDSGGQEIWMEVKNCTLVEKGLALFPDAVSLRATRHLSELLSLVRAGHRAVLLIMVQRSGARYFSPADSIDPAWGRALREAVSGGVELMVHKVDLSLEGAAFGAAIAVRL